MPAIAISLLGLLMLVAVERRVDTIHTEYTRHARQADVKYHGVEQGPITQRHDLDRNGLRDGGGGKQHRP